MDPVVVVGAGISGVACAVAVRAAGLPVRVLDRGHRLGGRMAGRMVDGRRVDTGASYFTVSDPAFRAVVDDWRDRGLATPWTDTFAVLSDDPPTSTTGPVRWAAPGGLRSLVEDLAADLDVEQLTVAHVGADGGRSLRVDGRRAAAVVLAMPDPQARRLLDTSLAAEASALGRDYEPSLTLTSSWPERRWDLEGAFVEDDDLEWVADDGRRRGDGAPVLVAHSTAALARRHLEEPEVAVPAMVAALRRRVDLPTGPPSTTHLHRWSYARPSAPRDERFLLLDNGLAACGDGWAARPRVEGAFLSGRSLGRAIVERFG